MTFVFYWLCVCFSSHDIRFLLALCVCFSCVVFVVVFFLLLSLLYLTVFVGILSTRLHLSKCVSCNTATVCKQASFRGVNLKTESIWETWLGAEWQQWLLVVNTKCPVYTCPWTQIKMPTAGQCNTPSTPVVLVLFELQCGHSWKHTQPKYCVTDTSVWTFLKTHTTKVLCQWLLLKCTLLIVHFCTWIRSCILLNLPMKHFSYRLYLFPEKSQLPRTRATQATKLNFNPTWTQQNIK